MKEENPSPKPQDAQPDNHGGGHGGGHKKSGGHGGGHGGGHHEEGEGGCPEWMISFADNVALLMGFFVIMLAMSMSDQAKSSAAAAGSQGEEAGEGALSDTYLDWVIGVREGFNNPVDMASKSAGDQVLIRRLRDRQREPLDPAEEGVRGQNHGVQSIRPSDYFTSGAKLPFERGSTAVSPDTIVATEQLAKKFRGLRGILEIRGHCSAAEANDQPDRGMRLSYERARAIAEVLNAGGIEWQRLRLTACADSERLTKVAQNENEHTANQRVEIVERAEATVPTEPESAPAQTPAAPEPEKKAEHP
jgi:chemotaxis protein MotB